MHSLVVPLPELDGANVGGNEDGTAQKRVEGSGEDRRHNGLNKQHGGVWRNWGQGHLNIKQRKTTSNQPN